MIHYVYRIDRPSTGEWYIGIRSCKCEPLADTRYMGSGTLVRRKVAAHPEEFTKTILVQVETREEAARIEADLIGAEQVFDPFCMNLCEGGSRGPLGCVPSLETRVRMRAAHKGRAPISEETRAKRSVALKNPSPETRAKYSAARRGQKRSPVSCARMSAAQRGRTPHDDIDVAFARIMVEEGYEHRVVGHYFGVVRQTVGKWIRRSA